MLKNLPTWLRAAIISAAQAAAAALLLIVIDLLFDVQDWIADPTNPVDLSGNAAAAFAAIVAAAQGIIVAIHRALRPPENTYPEPPTVPNLQP